MNLPYISRRGFCGSALAASSLVAAGVPVRALATEGRAPTGPPANVRVSHDGQPTHVEPSLAVNPRDPSNLLAACRVNGPLATYASFDGGLTWQSNGPLPLPAGTVEGNNVSVGFDGTGRGLVCGIFTHIISVSKPHPRISDSVWVWRTGDGGRTFTGPVRVTAPVAVSGVGTLDRPWLAAERRSRAVHVVWAFHKGTDPAHPTTALGYARSFDGGQTFEAPRTIASVTGTDPVGTELGNPMIACGPPGSVYVIYAVGPYGGAGPMAGMHPPEAPATVTVLCSRDGGKTFGPPVSLGQCTIQMSFPGLIAIADTFPAIATHPDRGLVCAAFAVHQAGASHSDILVTASQDAGRTWSAATAVTPQDHVIYFQPWVAIDDAGRIGVMAFALANDRVSVVLMLSKPGSLCFSRPITITSHPFNPNKSGPGGRDWFLGDNQALATTPGAFHPLWNDTRTGQLQLFTATVRASR
jgi:BNR repeat-like domain